MLSFFIGCGFGVLITFCVEIVWLMLWPFTVHVPDEHTED